MADLQHDIEKYLKGELSPADRHRLEKMALDDPFLADALEGATEISPEEFQQDLNQIHTSLDQRIARKTKGGSGWYWPMRIAAGVLLLVCSTYLVYFFLDTETTQDLALNKTEDTLPVEKEAEHVTSDSIAPIESLDEKSTVSAEPLEQKNEVAKIQTVPIPEKEVVEEKVIQNNEVERIAQVEEAEEIASEEKSRTEVSPAKSEALKIETKPEATSRAKKVAALPSVAAPQQETAGYRADKSTQRIITGKVIDLEDGSPLPGVNVVVKGTTQGTMTDLKGNYQISVDDINQSLVFSFIGLETKEENINGRTQLDVELDEDVSELSEVVVTGYGYNDSDDIFTSAIPDYIPAEPEGGFNAYKIYLDNNMHYPIQAIENKVQGKVTVRFEIGTNGSLSDFQITKGIGFGCDEEAIRLIRQGPKWSSPKRGDESVKGRVKVRMKFMLPK